MEYRIYYPQKPNMGDLLNKDMLESLFQIKVQRVNYNESNLIAIGSSLSLALYSSKLKVRIKQRIIRIF